MKVRYSTSLDVGESSVVLIHQCYNLAVFIIVAASEQQGTGPYIGKHFEAVQLRACQSSSQLCPSLHASSFNHLLPYLVSCEFAVSPTSGNCKQKPAAIIAAWNLSTLQKASHNS